MEGATLAAKERLDLALWQAWHTEAYARMEGRDFKDALKLRFEADANSAVAVKNAQGIAFFHRLQARGVPINITRH